MLVHSGLDRRSDAVNAFSSVGALRFDGRSNSPRTGSPGAQAVEGLALAGAARLLRAVQVFDVIGSDTGTRFRIHHGTQTNIEELGSNGRLVCKWCFGPDGNLAAGDVMLTQKIALETNERGALMVANRSYSRPDRGVFHRAA